MLRATSNDAALISCMAQGRESSVDVRSLRAQTRGRETQGILMHVQGRHRISGFSSSFFLHFRYLHCQLSSYDFLHTMSTTCFVGKSTIGPDPL